MGKNREDLDRVSLEMEEATVKERVGQEVWC